MSNRLNGLIFSEKIDYEPNNYMDKSGTIIIIEDDQDDQFVFEEVFKELTYPNKRMYFTDGLSALDGLTGSV